MFAEAANRGERSDVESGRSDVKVNLRPRLINRVADSTN